MQQERHNVFLPLAIFIMVAASLVFFLPAAISMNTQKPRQTFDGPDVGQNLTRKPSPLFHSKTDGLKNAESKTQPLFSQREDKEANVQATGIDMRSAKNTKGSLPLRTAAIVGSSAAVAAAFLAGGGAGSAK